MIDKLLKAKHWQLFILTFGLPLVFQIYMFVSIIGKVVTQINPDPLFILDYFKIFPLIMILFMSVLFAWLWSVAIGLQKKVPETVGLKVKRFKAFFIIQTVYIFFFIIFITYLLFSLPNFQPEPNIELIALFAAIIIPLHLFSIFCILHTIYFVAKTVKTVELQREVKFEEFVGEFFMIWFYPIGVWIIQPKINRFTEAN